MDKDNSKVQEKKIFADQIKRIRNKKNMSLREFGEALDPPVAKGTIYNWENAISMPNENKLESIANFAGISVSELLNGSFEDSLNDLLTEFKEKLFQMKEFGEPVKESIYLAVRDKYSYPEGPLYYESHLEELFDKINNMEEDFSKYSDRVIEEWKNPQYRQINLLDDLSIKFNVILTELRETIYFSSYTSLSADNFFSLKPMEGITQDYINDLDHLFKQIFNTLEELKEKYSVEP